MVAFKSRFGQVERQHVPLRKRRTAAQLRAQGEFGSASLGWNNLTDEQWDAWRERGKKVRSHPRGGESGPLTGQMFLTAINRNQALIGEPAILYPPERPAFGLNPVEGLSITQSGGGVALKLRVAKAPAAPILVFASRPYNAGRRYCDRFIYLGLLPAPEGKECDITELYLNKHVKPRPGMRVIILTMQQVNGWRDVPRRTEAVFRVSPGPAARAVRR